jgi:hypothetical protein
VARAGGAPRTNFAKALAILQSLASAGKLPAGDKDWIPQIKAALAKLPPQ